jgi:hypothetical protein
MKLLKKIFYSDRCLNTAEGIVIGLGLGFIMHKFGIWKA